MVKQSNTAFGKFGEDVASGFLERKGYKILKRNYRVGKAEIDIICSDQEDIVFVEVKLRTEGMMEYPEQAVGRGKQRNIRLAADYFMDEENLTCQARFDIVAVVSGATLQIEHFKDAFYPFDTY